MTWLFALLKNLDWSKLLGAIKWIVIGLLVLWVLIQFRNGIGAWAATIREAGRQEVVLVGVRNDLAIAKQQLEGERQARALAEARIKLLEGDYVGYRKATQAAIDSLRKHDLRNLMNAKPKQIEKLANDATAARFGQIQRLINE